MAVPLQQYLTRLQVAVSMPLLAVNTSKLARPTVAPPPSLRDAVTGIETPKPKSLTSMAPFLAIPFSGSDVDSPSILSDWPVLNNRYALNAINYYFPFTFFWFDGICRNRSQHHANCRFLSDHFLFAGSLETSRNETVRPSSW